MYEICCVPLATDAILTQQYHMRMDISIFYDYKSILLNVLSAPF